MDSNNLNNSKIGKELDIRDIVSYLLSKIWIIALATVCAVVFSFLVTSFKTPMYTSSTKTMLINKSATSVNNVNMSDLSAATYLTKMSSEIFTSDVFSQSVADLLNNDVDSFTDILGYVSTENGNQPVSFKMFYGGKIEFTDVKRSLSVRSNDETCAVTLSSTTGDSTLSRLIVTASFRCMQDHINDNFQVDKTIIVGRIDFASIPSAPSNIHYFRNMALSAAVAIVIICTILLAFYIFDDKIKTPDDIEKHLGLSVLGEIPEIEEE